MGRGSYENEPESKYFSHATAVSDNRIARHLADGISMAFLPQIVTFMVRNKNISISTFAKNKENMVHTTNRLKT